MDQLRLASYWPGEALRRPTEVRVERAIGRGRPSFERVAAALLRGDIQRAAGVRLHGVPRGRVLERGQIVTVALTPRWLRLSAVQGRCEIVELEKGTSTASFVYVTQPGHPEAGVQRFAVTLADDGEVTGTVESWSEPRARILRRAASLSRVGQFVIAMRYLGAMERCGTAGDQETRPL